MTIEVRAATTGDAQAMANLHSDRISEGFLSSLGSRFLQYLYRRVILSSDSFAAVACDEHDVTVGFIATSLAIGRLYRRFILYDGLRAGFFAAPKLLRSWRRVLETLRYPTHTGDLPDPEVLAVAVAESVAGRGVGRALLASAQRELEYRRVDAVKVVAGTHNIAAVALYRAAGFVEMQRIEVHEGVMSSVLVWRAPHLHVVDERGA